ncbi:hypothetical protein D3C86_1603550 [compost metagenome]
MPCNVPYSSMMTAICRGDFRSCSMTCSAVALSCTTSGSRSERSRFSFPSCRRSRSRSLVAATPRNESSLPCASINREWSSSSRRCLSVSWSASTSSQSISVRGVMIETTGRSASVSTPRIMSFSSDLNRSLCAACAAMTSAVSPRDGCSPTRPPRSRRMASEVRSRISPAVMRFSRLRLPSWFAASISTEKPMAA